MVLRSISVSTPFANFRAKIDACHCGQKKIRAKLRCRSFPMEIRLWSGRQRLPSCRTSSFLLRAQCRGCWCIVRPMSVLSEQFLQENAAGVCDRLHSLCWCRWPGWPGTGGWSGDLGPAFFCRTKSDRESRHWHRSAWTLPKRPSKHAALAPFFFFFFFFFVFKPSELSNLTSSSHEHCGHCGRAVQRHDLDHDRRILGLDQHSTQQFPINKVLSYHWS